MGRPRNKPNISENQEITQQEKTSIKEDDLLPKKSLFRVDEVADHFGVTTRTIYTWIAHNILQSVNPGGIVRIPRESILNCRFKDMFLRDDIP